MRQLLLDIGNTKIAAAVAEDGEIRERLRVEHGREGGLRPEEAVAKVHDWCLESRGSNLDGVAVVSVEPRLLELWMRLWEQRPHIASIPILQVDHSSALPFRLAVRNPHTIGADRLCNAAGATRRGLSTAILLGLGTAHTFDLLRDGVFVGGLIAPGAEAAHEAMLRRGARLPSIPFARPEGLLGDHTEAAMRSGSYHQSLGGILYILHRLLEEQPGAMILATGGALEQFAPSLPREVVPVPDLALEGLLAVLALSGASEMDTTG